MRKTHAGGRAQTWGKVQGPWRQVQGGWLVKVRPSRPLPRSMAKTKACSTQRCLGWLRPLPRSLGPPYRVISIINQLTWVPACCQDQADAGQEGSTLEELHSAGAHGHEGSGPLLPPPPARLGLGLSLPGGILP